MYHIIITSIKVASIALIFSLTSFAFANPKCDTPMSRESFKNILDETQLRYFPELNNLLITVTTFRSDSYFLQAQPLIKTLFGKRGKRSYTIQLNERLLECPPPLQGLEAILVHELEHILDYTAWTSGQIIGHGAHYSLSCGKRISYERATDSKVISKGLGEGLAQYRDWVYQWLTPKDLQTKRRLYITPEEIRNEF